MCAERLIDQQASDSQEQPLRALKIRSKWLDKILKGTKTLEIRSRSHNCDGPMYLLEVGTGLVRGTATLKAARCLTEQELRANSQTLKELGYRSPVAWPLEDVQPVHPVWRMPLHARRGCVVWVPQRRWGAKEGKPAKGVWEGSVLCRRRERPRCARAWRRNKLKYHCVKASSQRKWPVGALVQASSQRKWPVGVLVNMIDKCE